VPRAIILMLDSLGVGAAPDAGQFGDQSADTFGHIVETCPAIDRSERPGSALNIPNLCRLGLGHAAAASRGTWPAGLPKITPEGAWGFAIEKSAGKDTPSGHWEMAGVPVMTDWGYFPEAMPCFPNELTTQFLRATGLPGILGNCHASGTSIIEDLGQEHITSGKPICYTSADSVFQIAAHEEHFGLERLYDICESARKLVDGWNIARVIARPFRGQLGAFFRTANRRDYTTPPPQPTLLDKLKIAGGEVIGIGKISDIYAAQGISRNIKADGNMALFDATLSAMDEAGDQSIVFTNFVDFDMLFGHRRDVAGYADALEAFDRRLPELIKKLRAGDLVFATADHGCDPTFPGHDHTRENVPVLAFGPDVLAVPLGARQSFADIGQTVAAHLNLEPLGNGTSFLPALHH